MSPLARRWLLGVCGLAVAPAVAVLAPAMPRFGVQTEVLGQTINRLGPGLRHVDNMVTAVNFDFRSLDTLGEEFMLLCAVTGTVLLLRGQRGEGVTDAPQRVPGRVAPPRAESTWLLGRIGAPLVLLYALYVVLHATVTPGGGFQGGAIFASGAALIYLGEGYSCWRRLALSPALGLAEGGGATLFVAAGLAPMIGSGAFMQNRLPLGSAGKILSGGIMLIENAGVALAVGSGFLMLFLEFLEETREPKPPAKPDPQSQEDP